MNIGRDPCTGSNDCAARELIGQHDWDNIDLVDQAQLAMVVNVCLTSFSLSDAGRKLYAVSRVAKQKTNDADRLKKYLARFALNWELIKENRLG